MSHRLTSALTTVAVAITIGIVIPAVFPVQSGLLAPASASDPCSTQTASGVTISTARDGSDCLVAFKSGTGSWTVPSGVSEISYLVVGGGGGGGQLGGGGAGAFIEGTGMAVTPGSNLNVTVGTGGAFRTPPASGGNGSQSELNGVVAYGGGGGSSTQFYNGTIDSSRTVEKAAFSLGQGGSGGGGVAIPEGDWNSCPTGTTQVSAVGERSGQGIAAGSSGAGSKNTGGSSRSICYQFSTNPSIFRSFWVGAGGGGASEAGWNVTWAGANEIVSNVRLLDGTQGDFVGPGYLPGGGGNGIASQIVPASVAGTGTGQLGVGQIVSDTVYFAGGGAGGANYNSSGLATAQFDELGGGPSFGRALAGAGGIGGGGSSGGGQANTGGGGGGWRNGTGGSGVVVVRYSIPAPEPVAGLVASPRLIDGDADPDSVSVSWDALTGQSVELTSYEIEYSKNSDFSLSTSTSVTITNSATATPNSTTISGLDDGETYYFRIWAKNIGDVLSATPTTTASVAGSSVDRALETTGGSFASTTEAVIPTDSSAGFSVEFWAQLLSADASGVLLSQGDGTDTFYIKSSGGVLVIEQNNQEQYDPSIKFRDKVWTHVAVTVDPSDTSTGTKVYFDGNFVKEFSGARRNFTAAGGKGLHIGALSRSDGESPNGLIDQVKVWDGVLTASEVAESMNSWGKSAINNNLRAHWDFNDSSSSATLLDQQGNFNLSLTNVTSSNFNSSSILATNVDGNILTFKRSYLTLPGGWTPPAGVETIEYLVVGGGGGGNGRHGGGGGAGGFLEGTHDVSDGSTQPIVVGSGGTGSSQTSDRNAPYSLLARKGGDSAAFGVTAYGGGPGLGWGTYPDNRFGTWGSTPALTFGSGGAETSNNPGADGTAGQGNNGGRGAGGINGEVYAGAGGGGASAAGGNAGSGQGGSGGAGKVSTITGLTYAAGGGGGIGVDALGTAGAGGAGGGGAGGKAAAGTDGVAGTGSGGGGGGHDDTVAVDIEAYAGGSGGSGVVVVKFALQADPPTIDSIAESPTTLTVGFTPSGTGATATGFEYSLDGANWTGLSSSEVTAGSFSISGLNPATSYTVRLRALSSIDGVQYQGAAANSTATTLAGLAITTPTTGLAATYNAPFGPLTVQTAGGSGSNTFSIGSGSLPAGLSLDAASGVIAGTPTQIGTFAITVSVTDSEGSVATTSTFTISVSFITISFLAGGDGSGATQTLDKTFGVDLTLPDDTTANNWFERPGQKVVGWTTSDGGSLTHPLGGTYTGNADEDFYPVWACYSPTVVQTGLILHLDAFNSCSTGTAGKWKDISGNQRDLTWVGTAPTLVQENGKYYDFVEQYGTLSGEGLDDFNNGFSISFYANMFDAGNYARIIDFGNGADNDNIVVSRYSTTNKIILQMQLDQTRYSRCITPDIIDDGWHQITAVVATDGTCSFYKNGESVSPISQETAQDFATFTPTARSTNYVGRSNWTGNDLLDAGLGELAIYNRPLSSAEVATNFAAQVPQSYTVTLSYDGADGGERPSEKIYNVGGTAPTLPTPSKTGMLFGGWYSDPGLNTFVGYAGASYTPSANITLYARWTNLLINLDGSDDNSLANSGSSWTSILPGASNLSGQAIGNATYFSDPSGKEGFEFDGYGDAIQFAKDAAAFTGPISVEAWIQPSSFNSDWNVIASRWFYNSSGSTGAKDFHFAVKKYADGDYRLNLYTSVDGRNHASSDLYGVTSIDAASSKWYLVGFTIDENDNMQFYVNGVADGPLYTGVLRGADPDAYLWLGDGRTDYLGLIGRMSEFRLYNKGLTAAENFASVSAAASTYGLNTIEYRAGTQATGGPVYASKYVAEAISLLDSSAASSAFTRVGYTITGWATSDQGAKVYELGESFGQNQNLVLYPVWSADSHNFTFDYFTGTSATTFVTDGSVALFTPERTGYTFDGWSTSQSSNNGVLADKIQTWPYSPGVATDVTVYAIWTINSHNLTLVSEGNTTTQSVEFGATPADPQSSLQRTGYILQGWSVGNDATAEYAADLSDYTMPDTDATLYAVWLANTYTITYRVGSLGSGADQVVTKTHDVPLTLADADTANSWFTRTSHLVSGWATTDGGAEVYAFGATFTVEADTVLYPVWQSTVYSIEATGDTFVVSGTSSNANFGANSTLLFKNAGANITNSFNRVAYTEFEYDPDFNWIGGVLEIHVSGNADGSRNNGYNITYTSFNVDVFGANDASWDESTLTFNLANNSTQDWGLKTTVFPWNIDGGTYLGTISVPTSPTTVGQKFALATEALDDFLNADTDGNVTFYMRRSDIDAQANLSFASSEHPSLPGPTLTVAGAGYSYTIAYDINGGTGSIPAAGSFVQGGTPYVVAAGSGVVPPASKTFAGWNTKADGTGTDYAPGDVISLPRSVTLYAKFANFPRAIFKSNYSGGPSDVFQIITPNTNSNLRLNSFNQPGYSFAGWDTEPLGGGTDYADGASVNITSNLTLYAQWTPNTYQVLFEYNGADGNNSAISDSYTTGGTAINLPNPTRIGYNFAGWFSSSTFSGNSLGATLAPSANQTIYAKWDAIEYTLTYLGTNKTSGSQPTDSNTYNYLELATIKANTGNMVRNGYRFMGWVVDPTDVNETPKNSGQTVQFADANLTLHPVWEAETYTITYNSNGATSGSPVTPTDSYTTGDVMFTLPGAGTLAKPGYEFVGWSTQSNGGAPLVAVAPNINLDLFATWELVDYNFTYDLNGGNGTAVAMQTGDVERSLTIQPEGDAQKTGHWFGGWNTDPNGSGDSYAPGTSVRVPVGGLQLYAIWVPNQYRISYNGNGGIGGPNITGGFDEATFGQDYLIRDKGTLSREGYNFLHWTTNAAGTGDRYDESQNSGELNVFRPNANTTFFAQWSPVQYSMTFDTAGGNASLGMPQKTIGQVLQLPSPGEKRGYTFSHWSHAGAEYPEGSSFTAGAANATFTAVWIPNTYTVTYDWQGGQTSGLAQVGRPFTVGTGPMNLPDGSGYSRDGFDFAGWSQTPGGTPVSDFEPDNNAVLYALWQPGNFTLRFDVNTQGQPEASAAVPRGQATILPAPPSREGFVFTGWFDADQNGLKVGDAGDSYTPNASTLLHANWVQKSLFGVDIAQLETGATINVGVAGSGGSVTVNHAPTNTSASVTVPNGALPQGTTISARYFREIDARQADLIPGDNKYIFSLLVSWMLGSGDAAAVPMTDPDKPIEVRMTSDAIKAGQMIYQLIGDQYTELGRAEVDGELTVFLYEDPEIVVAATTPEAPEIDSVETGMNSATLTWTEPVDGGSPITSYTVTSNPGGLTCTTVETTCTITGLSDGIEYTFTVLASNSVGDSEVSGSSEPISPEPTVYVVTYDSNGGSAVADGSFQVGNTIAPPLQPTRSGYTFLGWTTTLDDETTLVTFPYDPGVDANITLFALWERNPVVVTPTPEEPGPAAGIPAVTGETKAWTKRISANTVKVYIKFPEMGKNYQIRIQKDNGEYVRLMSKTINSTADADLSVVGEWYYIVRTIELPGEGRYRIEILEDGERITLNGKDRPVVYSYINAV